MLAGERSKVLQITNVDKTFPGKEALSQRVSQRRVNVRGVLVNN